MDSVDEYITYLKEQNIEVVDGPYAPSPYVKFSLQKILAAIEFNWQNRSKKELIRSFYDAKFKCFNLKKFMSKT